MSAWLNSQWAWTSSKSTAEGSVVPLWQTARDKGMRHGTSNGSACAVTMSPSGHKYSYQLLLPTTALYQDLCQPAAMLSSLSLSFTHTHIHTHTCTCRVALRSIRQRKELAHTPSLWEWGRDGQPGSECVLCLLVVSWVLTGFFQPPGTQTHSSIEEQTTRWTRKGWRKWITLRGLGKARLVTWLLS